VKPSSDDRYAAALESLVSPFDLILPGIGLVVAPSGEQAFIAAALAPLLGAAVLPLDEAAASDPVAPRVLVAGLPPDTATAAHQLTELNGRRDFISSRGRMIVVIVSPFEIVQFQRHAPDVYSSIRFLKVVRFVPDPAVDEAEARASLARYHRERFGRLDLRGFIRSEEEDVSFSIEEIYQDIQASYISRARLPLGSAEEGTDRRVLGWLEVLPRDRPIAVLGHPGSGKTFLLRWLALATGRPEVQASLKIAAPLPLLASLAAYTQAPQPMDLLEYLTESLLAAGQPAAHVIHKAIDAREAVFLLDGLDEVGDETARRRVLDAVGRLEEQVPGCLLLVTSRIAGYGPDIIDAHHLLLSPLDDEVIRSFLVRWCELYAVGRLGGSDVVRRNAQSEGQQLAKDVLGSAGVLALARNPLMLTVLAIVHRAGVRLPDHRVELYAHATRVLVERWNRVRSLSGDGSAPPLKAVDAVRLLGPLALRMVRSGTSTVIDEGALRVHVERVLEAGTLRGVASADEIITLFRKDLGLLVEQAPGVYAFLHLTLAEYFAAWELVRSDALERLAADPTRAYLSQVREVLLLAAGELGVLRGDDGRLDQLVATLVGSALQRTGYPSPTVPSLLAGLLSDDPHLTGDAARKIVGELIPKWWFERTYGRHEALPFAVQEATRLLQDRIRGGRFGPLVRHAVEQAYGSGISGRIFLNLARGGSPVLRDFLRFLEAADVDYGPQVLLYLSSGKVGPEAVQRFRLPFTVTGMAGGVLRGCFRVSRYLDERVRSGALRLQLRLTLLRSSSNDRFFVQIGPWRGYVIPWDSTLLTVGQTQATVTVEVAIQLDPSIVSKVDRGYVSIEPVPSDMKKVPVTP
jgi:hypothetical protein